MKRRSDGTIDDDFNDESLRGRPSDIGWTPPPIRFSKRGAAIGVTLLIIALLVVVVINQLIISG